jgi:hypothetical protein
LVILAIKEVVKRKTTSMKVWIISRTYFGQWNGYNHLLNQSM